MSKLTKYEQALSEAYERMYGQDDATIDREGSALAREYPAASRADMKRGIVGYRFEVYANMRAALGASHEEAMSCVLGKLVEEREPVESGAPFGRGWQEYKSRMLGDIHGERALVLIASYLPATGWALVAIETTAEAARDATGQKALDDHAHATVEIRKKGKRATWRETERAARGYAAFWRLGQAAKRCDCGPIEASPN